MDMIELGQMDQHNFDLDVRSREDCSPEVMMSAYHELLTGEPLTDEYVHRFEKVLAGLIGSNAAHVGLLHEMNFSGVEPLDAAAILKDGAAPGDEVMDMIANIRAQFDEAAEKYAEELEGRDLVAPLDPNPTDEQRRAAKLTLARYIIAAILTDDREENELS
ncbi:hypothetical protein STRATTON_127 [Erwinia phage vB_EamM_Stratton]|uniref:Uncharacterized protein n=2 Tax=Erskinevirus EaH2 TaxID=2169883 RepID=A0A1B2IH36_9CAUD|nr:hypothetical protein G173_gp032 [Erwinia phage phiEaH2]AFQ96577.1 hypothetical protein [Erwinia phage phiEaH2]ANZ50552.1 hypothetical protein STRATTON_127 [Erwinia phage vB_EamM_Stratton]